MFSAFLAPYLPCKGEGYSIFTPIMMKIVVSSGILQFIMDFKLWWELVFPIFTKFYLFQR